MRLGFIASGGGSAIAASVECLRVAQLPADVVMVTDRRCGALEWGTEAGLPVANIPYVDMEQFSTLAAEFFADHGCQNVLLFFTRKVGRAILDRLDVWNVHPSILPSYKGFQAIESAMADGVRMLGTTLHKATMDLDAGQIEAQFISPVSRAMGLTRWKRLSYMQKVMAVLVWYESISGVAPGKANVHCWSDYMILGNPGLSQKDLCSTFDAWLRSTDMPNQEMSGCVL